METAVGFIGLVICHPKLGLLPNAVNRLYEKPAFKSRKQNLRLLVIGGSRCQDVRLQLWEKPLLIFPLANLHIEQVRVDGCVVNLHQPLLDGLGCR